MSHRRTGKGCLAAFLFMLMLILALIAFVWFQGRRTPEGRPEYVALGSSFAAGAGLGQRQPDSPLLCARSVNGYPQQLARMRGLSIVDMSCGGAIAKDVLRGGQFLQGPQVRTINSATRLVTITVGGNDIGYVGDLSLLAARNSTTFFGRLVRLFWSGPKQPGDRNYEGLRSELLATLRAVRQQAPEATIILATYPTILPPAGTCAQIGLTDEQADFMRQVASQLAAITRSAAEQGGAVLVDMHSLGAEHNACSSSPWTAGWTNASDAPFHPTLLGAKATAEAIASVLGRLRGEGPAA